jgi:hypothetical protein
VVPSGHAVEASSKDLRHREEIRGHHSPRTRVWSRISRDEYCPTERANHLMSSGDPSYPRVRDQQACTRAARQVADVFGDSRGLASPYNRLGSTGGPPSTQVNTPGNLATGRKLDPVMERELVNVSLSTAIYSGEPTRHSRIELNVISAPDYTQPIHDRSRDIQSLPRVTVAR